MANVSIKLTEITDLQEQLQDLVEERKRLQLLQINPSENDDSELKNLLNKLHKKLSYLQDDITESINEFNGSKSKAKRVNGNSIVSLEEEFNSRVFKFNKYVDSIELVLEREIRESTLDIESYKFEQREFPELAAVTKSVRFKDNLVDSPPMSAGAQRERYTDSEEKDEDEQDLAMKSQLFGKSTEPTGVSVGEVHYSDHPEPVNPDATNQQLLEQQQMLLRAQDDDISQLAESVRKTKTMGYMINNEIDSQMVVMDDLEGQMDHTQSRLNKAQSSLHIINKKVKEQGHCFTIIVLTVILFFLVVVL